MLPGSAMLPAAAAAPEMQTPLISTDAKRGLLSFPNIVTEADGATLGSLTVTSHSAQPLLVRLESSSPEQITFQLENENLRNAAAEDDDPEDWNALFNEVGHIKTLHLPPHGQSTLVVSFKPKPLSAQAVEYSPDGLGEPTSNNRPYDDHPATERRELRERHAIQEARASIQLIAVPQQEPPMLAQLPPPPSTNQPPPPPPPPLQAEPAPPVVVTLSARHCVSLLRTDAHELSFDHVMVGSTAVKDFTVWNCSEVPLRFRLALTYKGAANAATDDSRSALSSREARPGIVRASAPISTTTTTTSPHLPLPALPLASLPCRISSMPTRVCRSRRPVSRSLATRTPACAPTSPQRRSGTLR